MISIPDGTTLGEPSQCSFYNPSPSRILFVAKLIDFLFADTPDMLDVRMLSHSLMTSEIIISFIKTQVLGALRCGLGALDNNGFQSRLQKPCIVYIGSGHNHTQRATSLFHKNSPLGSSFTSISGVGTN